MMGGMNEKLAESSVVRQRGWERKSRRMDGKRRILIVEDDQALAGEMGEFLLRWGYGIRQAGDFSQVLEAFKEYRPQLVLMDINLPFYDGFYWCGQIRQISQVPVLFISSRGDDRDKIMAVAQGGDDYIEKPFQLELLKAKLQAILRRTYEYQVREPVFLGGALRFDQEQQALYLGGQEIELTKSERRVLTRLAESRPQVVTREELMMNLWETDEYVSDGTLTTMICRLRNKLKGACGSEVIGTKKGQGYFLP